MAENVKGIAISGFLSAISTIVVAYFVYSGQINTSQLEVEKLKLQISERQEIADATCTSEKGKLLGKVEELSNKITILENELNHTEQASTISQIIGPTQNASVQQTTLVSGIAINESSNTHLWLLVHPIDSAGWWPQSGEIIPNQRTNEWSAQANIGGEGDRGKHFQISLASVTATAHQQLSDYLANGKESNNYPERPFPAGANILDTVLVTRE